MTDRFDMVYDVLTEREVTPPKLSTVLAAWIITLVATSILTLLYLHRPIHVPSTLPLKFLVITPLAFVFVVLHLLALAGPVAMLALACAPFDRRRLQRRMGLMLSGNYTVTEGTIEDYAEREVVQGWKTTRTCRSIKVCNRWFSTLNRWFAKSDIGKYVRVSHSQDDILRVEFRS